MKNLVCIIKLLTFILSLKKKFISFKTRKYIYIHYLTKNWDKYKNDTRYIPIESVTCYEQKGYERIFDLGDYSNNEAQMLQAFFDYLMKKKSATWCHWNMRSQDNYGFLAILTRYIEITNTDHFKINNFINGNRFKQIDVCDLIWKKNKNGWEFAKKQQEGGMHFLAKKNSIGTNRLIEYQEEQKYADENNRPPMKNSLSRKTKIIEALHSKLMANELQY